MKTYVEDSKSPECDPNERAAHAALPLAPANVAPEECLRWRRWGGGVDREVVVDHGSGCHRCGSPGSAHLTYSASG